MWPNHQPDEMGFSQKVNWMNLGIYFSTTVGVEFRGTHQQVPVIFSRWKIPSFEMEDDWGYPVMTRETPKYQTLLGYIGMQC